MKKPIEEEDLIEDKERPEKPGESGPSSKTVEPIDEDFISIEEKLKEKFNDTYINFFKRLAYEVAIVGLSEEEGCTYLNFDYQKFVALKAQNPLIEELFKRKSLQFKRDMVLTLSSRARNGDDKLAQWLLESKYPDEFNRKKGTGGGSSSGDGSEMLGAAIEFVRKTTGPTGIIKLEAGRAFMPNSQMVKQGTSNIHDHLSGRVERVINEIASDNGR